MRDFEDGTRSQAAEIVVTLAESVPASIRKVEAIKTDFFPALVELITCCEPDMDAWNESVDDEFGAGNDAYSIGISCLERLSLQMKESVTLKACGSLIEACLSNSDWKIR